ncbi:MAG: hypothetical protein ACI8PD_001938 [Nitrospinales bacterium]|jgi:hypothetical protein
MIESPFVMSSNLFLNLLFHGIAPIFMRYSGVCQGIYGPTGGGGYSAYVEEPFVMSVFRFYDMMVVLPLVDLMAF